MQIFIHSLPFVFCFIWLFLLFWLYFWCSLPFLFPTPPHPPKKIYSLSIFSLMTFGFLSHGWKSIFHSKIIKILLILFLVLLWFYFWHWNCWPIWTFFWCTVIGVSLFFIPDGQQVIPTPFIEYSNFPHCLSLSGSYSPVSQAACSYIRTTLVLIIVALSYVWILVCLASHYSPLTSFCKI